MSKLPGFQTLVCTEDGPVLNITLNRPERLNAFNARMFGEIGRMAEIASRDSKIRVAVFRGSGPAFSSGADLNELSQGRNQIGKDGLEHRIMAAQRVFDTVAAMPMPTIAAISGPAVGAGFQLAIACDFRIAVNGVKMGLSDVRIGIIPALGATARLPKLIGLAKSKELIMCGNLFWSEDAHQMGLINRLVDRSAFEESIENLTQMLIERAPLAVSEAKKLLDSEASPERVAASQQRLFKSRDALEGITAFLEKRKPSFTGS
jgi:enoyl-CoA hydratase/carnithine racemase